LGREHYDDVWNVARPDAAADRELHAFQEAAASPFPRRFVTSGGDP